MLVFFDQSLCSLLMPFVSRLSSTSLCADVKTFSGALGNLVLILDHFDHTFQ